ncbi:hypothetical protein ACOME3_002236 [Neoechinorhynchus agilis]
MGRTRGCERPIHFATSRRSATTRNQYYGAIREVGKRLEPLFSRRGIETGKIAELKEKWIDLLIKAGTFGGPADHEVLQRIAPFKRFGSNNEVSKDDDAISISSIDSSNINEMSEVLISNRRMLEDMEEDLVSISSIDTCDIDGSNEIETVNRGRMEARTRVGDSMNQNSSDLSLEDSMQNKIEESDICDTSEESIEDVEIDKSERITIDSADSLSGEDVEEYPETDDIIIGISEPKYMKWDVQHFKIRNVVMRIRNKEFLFKGVFGKGRDPAGESLVKRLIREHEN